MSEEDIKLLLEMKHNCLKDNGTTNETYNDYKRIMKAKAIDNVLQEIERLNNIIDKLEKYVYGRIEYCYNNGAYQDVFDVYNEIDMKLQELKGSDKDA